MGVGNLFGGNSEPRACDISQIVGDGRQAGVGGGKLRCCLRVAGDWFDARKPQPVRGHKIRLGFWDDAFCHSGMSIQFLFDESSQIANQSPISLWNRQYFYFSTGGSMGSNCN